MELPKTREEFELRFHNLFHGVKNGKNHLGPTVDNLLLLRKLPNGRLDFLSVNEGARLSANSMYHWQQVFKRNPRLFDTKNDE